MLAKRSLMFARALPAQRGAMSVVGFSTSSPFEKSQKLGRPVSPHVMIYDFPLAAISSVMHRFTGMGLTFGMYGMGLACLGGVDVGMLMSNLGQSSLGGLAKLSLTFPLFYHTLAGVRHLYWEQKPEGLNPQTQKQASVVVITASTLLAFTTVFFL